MLFRVSGLELGTVPFHVDMSNKGVEMSPSGTRLPFWSSKSQTLSPSTCRCAQTISQSGRARHRAMLPRKRPLAEVIAQVGLPEWPTETECESEPHGRDDDLAEWPTETEFEAEPSGRDDDLTEWPAETECEAEPTGRDDDLTEWPTETECEAEPTTESECKAEPHGRDDDLAEWQTETECEAEPHGRHDDLAEWPTETEFEAEPTGRDDDLTEWPAETECEAEPTGRDDDLTEGSLSAAGSSQSTAATRADHMGLSQDSEDVKVEVTDECSPEEGWWQEAPLQDQPFVPRKAPRTKVNQDVLEAKTGMCLDNMPPKEAVNVFLSRYHARQMKKGRDFKYSVTEVQGGFYATLTVPAWDGEIFVGSICDTEKEAERSAAKVFCEDPAVVEAAANLPPPMWALNMQARNDMQNTFGTIKSMPSRWIQQAASEACRQRAHGEYAAYRDAGCRNALWDGYS